MHSRLPAGGPPSRAAATVKPAGSYSVLTNNPQGLAARDAFRRAETVRTCAKLPPTLFETAYAESAVDLPAFSTSIKMKPIHTGYYEIYRNQGLRRHRRSQDRRQRLDRARAPAADQGRARHRQNLAGQGGRESARCTASDLAHQAHHQGSSAPLRLR